MTTYQWAPDNSRMRAACMVPFGTSGLLLPLWPKGPTLWNFNGSTLSSATVALAANNGFSSAASDGASGAWCAQYSGSLLHYTTTGASGYGLPGNQVYVGCAYVSTYGVPYVLTALGVIYEGTGANPIGGYGQPAWFLASSGQTLFSLVSGSLAAFTLSAPNAGTASYITYPMVEGSCLATNAATSAVAVGGWSYVT